MTKEEYAEYLKTSGQTELQTLTALLKSPAYQKMNDAEKASAIADAQKYATSRAKLTVDSTVEVDEWTNNASKQTNPADWIAYHAVVGNSGSEQKGKQAIAAYNSGIPENVIVGNLSEAAQSDYANCKAVGVSLNQYLKAYDFYNNTDAKDENGNSVSGFKKKRTVEYIQSLGLNNDKQKNALLEALGASSKGVDWSKPDGGIKTKASSKSSSNSGTGLTSVDWSQYFK